MTEAIPTTVPLDLNGVTLLQHTTQMVFCVCLYEGIMGYIESLRGPASKQVSVDDIWRQVSKSDDSSVLCVGFFNDASDAAFQTYDEASKILIGLFVVIYLSLMCTLKVNVLLCVLFSETAMFASLMYLCVYR